MPSRTFFKATSIDLPHGFGTKGLEEVDLLRAFRGLTPVRIKQVHGADVLVLKAGDPIPQRAPYDAALTDRDDCLLWVKTADCLPILLWESRRGIIGVVHAGWRGVLRGVIRRTVEVAVEAFGTSPAAIVAAIGPCIRGCCYEVGEEVARPFEERFGASVLRRDGGRITLDLALCAKEELGAMGVTRVEDLGLCTCCQPDLFWSFRRQRTTNRQLNFITKGRCHVRPR